MDETIPFILSGVLTLKFTHFWYSPILFSWSAGRGVAGRVVLGLLPIVALGIILFILKTLAASDVRDDLFYIIGYTVMGLAWLYLGVLAMGAFFDLSFRDDILGMGNTAALHAFVGGFLGMTFIYAGANVGDGPGWWCVIFAGGLGIIAWFALAMLVNRFTDVFEKITVERNIGSGVRFGAYLLASGVIFGRASSGDWTSWGMTIVEFGIGWPALPLALLAIMCERFAKNGGERHHGARR